MDFPIVMIRRRQDAGATIDLFVNLVEGYNSASRRLFAIKEWIELAGRHNVQQLKELTRQPERDR
jgi:hypothetical protein